MGYRGKLVVREQARALRAQGWTMPDIAAELGVSRSSVSMWTRDVVVEMGPRRVRTPRPNRLRDARLAEIDAMNRLGLERLGALGEQAFLAAGAALYAGEGAKRDRWVGFTNSDPTIVGFFLAWLRAHFAIDEARLRVRIHLHEGLDLGAATAHWVAVTGVPVAQFRTPA
jgi:transcriptional regulator with XRE-family HTH domain